MPETGKGPSAEGAARRPPKDRPRYIGDLLTLAGVFGLLGAVYLLPADTSLSQLQEGGRLTACMPTSYPPLVTGDSSTPGFDVELLREVAARLGVSFGVNPSDSIARDFNPRSWRVTRAQCQVIAGGVILSQATLSFLDATTPYLATGWAVVTPGPEAALEGQAVAFFAGVSGLDRIALSRWLRAQGAEIRVVATRAALEEGLADGTFAAGVTESLQALQVAEDHDWTVAWVPTEESDVPVGIGLWKGDLTLKRAITGILDDLEDEGFVDALRARYEIPPIERTFGEPAAS